MIVQILNLVLQVTDLVRVVINNLIQLFLGFALLLCSSLLDSVIQLGLPFFDEGLLLCFKCCLQSVLTIQLLCQEIIILLV